MIYCRIEGGLVVNRIEFVEQMPADWPEYSSYVQNDEAQIGWSYAGGIFTPSPASPPPVYLPVIDANARITAGVVAALDIAIAVKVAMANIPDNFNAQNFAAAKIQLDALTEAFAGMLQAQADVTPNLKPKP